MLEKIVKKKVLSFLSGLDISVNGSASCNIEIHDARFYSSLALRGSLGLGESYIEGWWDADPIDEFLLRLIEGKADKNFLSVDTFFCELGGRLFNLQTKRRSLAVASKHYNIGNDLYSRMLDDLMMYSCGYWKNAVDLNQAQTNKLDLIARKLNFQPKMKVLDIGCGWGGACKYFAEKYQVELVGITISSEQAILAKERCQGLPIDIRLQDYRELKERFNAIYSIGMFEHVGYKNYTKYMEAVASMLEDHSLFLLHTIGRNESNTCTDPWINKYIFPNGMVPSIKQIGKAAEDFFIMEDWHNFSRDYDKTLLAWFKNFDTTYNEIQKNYDERFYRLWKYYLHACAASFRARDNQLWQVLFSKDGMIGELADCR
jgi:cyclopropane-fatty-acyl-phospholipid synthase